MRSIIGYAQADFKTLITDNKLYVDRTAFIEMMENHSNTNLVFVRPRRFGKSLWLSILQYYYGVEHKDLFEMLFGKLAIGQNPTALRNTYLILRLQFAGIDVMTDELTFKGFRANVMTGILNCMATHSTYFSEENKAKIEATDTPANMLQRFFQLCENNKLPYPIYILIDEYDQFANELVSLDTERYQSIVGSTGFVRKFYEMIKNAANEGVVSRFFATGVSPMTIDAMTSGFNISSSLSLELDFHDLMGFRQTEVIEILRKVGAKEVNIPTIIADLKAWYNGYLFHEEATERLYNSDMIMYFASHYEKRQKYPSRMLDANIATDYKKVKKVFSIQQRETDFIPILKELTTEGILSAQITDFFNLEEELSDEGIISFLYYMGWISILDMKEGLHRFRIPNLVVNELWVSLKNFYPSLKASLSTT
jgi:Predicted AAA-ATPase